MCHHLCAATTDFFNAQNIFDDHPAIEILRNLEATAYYLDRNLLGQRLSLARRTFLAILRWADMLNCYLKVGAPHYFAFIFLTQRPRVWLSLFPVLFWWDECAVWWTKCIGKCYANQQVKGRILLWAQLILTFFKVKLSFGLRSSTGSYFLGTYYLGYRWRVEFRLHLLTLLQLQSYLVPCISARTFIIPKLQNIYCELISLCIEHFPYCYSTRHSFIPGRSLWEHLSRALPTETIFYGLRTIPSDRLFRDYSTKLKLNTLEIIVKWLQVSISECNPRTPQIENPICV